MLVACDFGILAKYVVQKAPERLPGPRFVILAAFDFQGDDTVIRNVYDLEVRAVRLYVGPDVQ